MTDTPTLTAQKREIASFPEGEAFVVWPPDMSVKSVAEFEKWLKLLLRKMKKRAEKLDAGKASAPAETE